MTQFYKLVVLLLPLICYGAVRLDGYFENVNHCDWNLRWYMSEPHNNLELRFTGTPAKNIEAFIKFHAESDKFLNNNRACRYTIYDMLEMHGKFRWDRGLEVVVFSRENRFWFPQGLMELVSQWVVNDGGNAQGVRIDFWNLWKFYGVIIHSDYSQSSGEDANILRWNLPLFDNKVRISSTLARKDWGTESGNYNAIYSLDAHLSVGRLLPFLHRFGNIALWTEVARSHIPENPQRNLAFAAEVRNIRWGGLDAQFSYHKVQENFRSYLSSDYDWGQKYNEEGFSVQGTYFFPMKAVNFTSKYSYYVSPVNRAFPVCSTNPKRRYQEWYNELYIEFIYDVKCKIWYRYYRGWDMNYDAYKTYPSLFGEISFENYFAKVRLQAKWKDIGTPYDLQAFGIEINANISRNWKLYIRSMNVNEIAESRQTVFAQLQYHGWSNTDFFIEFGNPYDSDNDLTNDDDFVDVSANHGISKQLKTYIRFYF